MLLNMLQFHLLFLCVSETLDHENLGVVCYSTKLDGLPCHALFTIPETCLFLGNVSHALLYEILEYCDFSEELPSVILIPRAKLDFLPSVTLLMPRSYKMESLCTNRHET